MPLDSASLGVSFVPSDQNTGRGGVTPGVQQALKVLSLRLPKQLGNSAIAPRNLLMPQARAGVTPDQAVLYSVLKAMLSAEQSSPAKQPDVLSGLMGSPSLPSSGAPLAPTPAPSFAAPSNMAQAPTFSGAPAAAGTPAPPQAPTMELATDSPYFRTNEREGKAIPQGAPNAGFTSTSSLPPMYAPSQPEHAPIEDIATSPLQAPAFSPTPMAPVTQAPLSYAPMMQGSPQDLLTAAMRLAGMQWQNQRLA